MMMKVTDICKDDGDCILINKEFVDSGVLSIGACMLIVNMVCHKTTDAEKLVKTCVDDCATVLGYLEEIKAIVDLSDIQQ